MSTKPSILIGMGLGKKPGPPLPPAQNRGAANPLSKTPPAISAGQTPSNSMNPQGNQGQKASPEEAGFIPASQKCGDCTNYEKSTKDCTKVDGVIQAMDSCSKFFQAASGGMNDNDGDEGILAIGGPSGTKIP